MKKFLLLILMTALFNGNSFAQQKGYAPYIETCPCIFKADSSHKTTCGYLVVPENRSKPTGKTIKLPFIVVESNNPNKQKDPVLFSGGGPGLSSLHPVTSIHRRSLLKNRDYIAFEQRGTHYAIPNLECGGISEAIKDAYRNGTPPDEAALEATRQCRKKLIAQGIDLSAYNTDENAADIEDLRIALKIDSINLLGISYSGGLMMTVLKKYPQHIRSLILDSPLPEFVNIDEQELSNFNEVLDTVFKHAETDIKYAGLKERFHNYFTAIGGKAFYYNYTEKDGAKSIRLRYGRNELLTIIHGAAEDYDQLKELPAIITEMIDGKQDAYIKSYFDGVFNGNGSISGMRLSVYCSDKMAYADPEIIAEQDEIRPYLAGFHVNDVYPASCKCWAVKPILPSTKKSFYSNVPALLGAGGMDDSCRPIYNDLIHHYFPNSQRLLFTDRQHGPLLNSYDGDVFIGQFLDHPFQKLVSSKKEIIAY